MALKLFLIAGIILSSGVLGALLTLRWQRLQWRRHCAAISIETAVVSAVTEVQAELASDVLATPFVCRAPAPAARRASPQSRVRSNAPTSSWRARPLGGSTTPVSFKQPAAPAPTVAPTFVFPRADLITGRKA